MAIILFTCWIGLIKMKKAFNHSYKIRINEINEMCYKFDNTILHAGEFDLDSVYTFI